MKARTTIPVSSVPAPESHSPVRALARDRGLKSFPCANLRLNRTTSRHKPMAPRTREGKPAREAPPDTLAPAAVGAPGSQPSFFLRTKLLPPRPSPELLSRPRLTERLLANVARPVTLVTANAGSGKTTLVADFLRTHNRQFVWYQLDHTDADPFVFLGYITHGIQQVVPDFGKTMFSYL